MWVCEQISLPLSTIGWTQGCSIEESYRLEPLIDAKKKWEAKGETRKKKNEKKNKKKKKKKKRVISFGGRGEWETKKIDK